MRWKHVESNSQTKKKAAYTWINYHYNKVSDYGYIWRGRDSSWAEEERGEEAAEEANQGQNVERVGLEVTQGDLCLFGVRAGNPGQLRVSGHECFPVCAERAPVCRVPSAVWSLCTNSSGVRTNQNIHRTTRGRLQKPADKLQKSDQVWNLIFNFF